MSDLLNIEKVILPFRFVLQVYEHLRTSGNEGVEGVGLWLGRQEEKIFTVHSCVIPAQQAFKLDEGLLYQVGAEELHRLNKWAYQQKIVLLAQIHSHPGLAYHSETDDEYPIVATQGGFSIVIPNFGFDSIDKRFWKVYRLRTDGWVGVPELEVQELFEIIN